MDLVLNLICEICLYRYLKTQLNYYVLENKYIYNYLTNFINLVLYLICEI